MELKIYDKPWLPAFKGAFLILFGLLAMIQAFGSIKTLAVLFIALIGMIAILLLSTAILFKTAQFRGWTAVLGVLNLAFAIYLAMHTDSSRSLIVWTVFAWVMFYAVSEIIESILLINSGNAFFALFLMNAVLTLSFGYFLYQLKENSTEKALFYVGVIAIVFGIANEFSSYLLSRVKK
jgi:uncharacterized membrane protein HdeD (DUF308 family)